MKYKIEIWVLALAFVLVSTASAFPQSMEKGIYRDPQQRFTLQVPTGWTVTVDKDHKDILIMSHGNVDATVLIFEDRGEAASVVNFFTNQIAKHGKQWKSFQELKHGDCSFAGQRGAFAIATGMNPKGTEEIIKVVALVTNGKGYALILSAPMAEYNSVKGKFDQIQESFSLGDRAAAPGKSYERNPAEPPRREATQVAEETVSIRPQSTSKGIYHDPQQRFTLQVPTGWTAVTVDKYNLSMTRGNAWANVLIFEDRGEAASVVHLLTNQIGKQWKNFQELKRGDCSFAGQRGAFAIAAGVNPKGAEAIIKVVALVTNGKGYALILSAPVAEFAAVKSGLDRIEQSFQIEQSFSPGGSSLVQPGSGAPMTGALSRPVLEVQRGQYFAWAIPKGWRASETTNEVNMHAPDGKAGLKVGVIVSPLVHGTPQDYATWFLRILSLRPQVVAVRNLPDQNSGIPFNPLKVTEIEATDYSREGTKVHGTVTCGVLQGRAIVCHIFVTTEENWAAYKLWLPAVARSVTVINPQAVAQQDKVIVPRNNPLDNSALIASWRRKGISEHKLSVDRQEATMGYDHLTSPTTGRNYQIPFEYYDASRGGYHNPDNPSEILQQSAR